MHNIFVISAPSGCGKTSLVKALVQQNQNLKISISHTTRAKREYEQHGVDYFFIDKAKFDLMVKNNDFIEHARVFDNYYGTSKNALKNMLQTHSVIIEIDWQGARQIKQIFPQAISIFILPPSIAELQKRLELRGDDEELIKRRMKDAENEISHANEYDYQIINDDFNQALTQIQEIIDAKK
jgi:guanylate kinase